VKKNTPAKGVFFLCITDADHAIRRTVCASSRSSSVEAM
jgi:hypothetical protein